MSVSNSKGAGPSGLDQALQLIQVCKDPQKYAELLDPLKKSAKDARQAWQKVEVAGEIHAALAQAKTDRDAAAALLVKAEQDAKKKKADQDREYSAKLDSLRQRERGFASQKNEQEADMAKREGALKTLSVQLESRKTELDKGQSALNSATKKLEQDRSTVEHRFEAMKEAFNG